MNKMEKFGKVLGVIGGVVVIVGFFHLIVVAKAFDTEHCYSFGWLVTNVFIGLAVYASGFGLFKLSDDLVNLSHKKFRRVWIRNIISNKVTSRLVEVDSSIVLSDDEVVHKVDRDVYCFR